jgi:pimeloyl-ACP methyl ester carboxylesterase
MTFSHNTASVNGIQLHYVIGGQGDPVVLLHGWPETWYAWHKIMPALAKNYTVIAPDLRGLGDSSKPPTGYDGNTVAEDIHQLVTQLGFEGCQTLFLQLLPLILLPKDVMKMLAQNVTGHYIQEEQPDNF